jgi:hypothetical protein
MRYYAVIGCVLALQIVAGHPQYMVYCLGALVLYLTFRALCDCRDTKCISPFGRMCGGLAIVLIVGIALSAVQLFPSWEFKNQSARSLLRGPEAVSDVSFPPENVVTLVAPAFFGDMFAVRYWGRWLFWETCAYVGILPLVCALMGALFVRNRYTWFFSGLAVLSLLLAFGAYSPLFKALYYYVPGFALFRGQAKFIFLTAFSLSVLAGYGTRCITLRAGERKKQLLVFGGATLAVAVLLLLFCLIMAAGGGEHSPLWRAILRCRAAGGFEGTPPIHPSDIRLISSAYEGASTALVTAAIWMGITSSIIMVAARVKKWPAALGTLILLVAIADFWHYGSKYVMVSPLSSCYWPRDVADFFSPDRLNYRTLAPRIAVPGANQNMNEGIYAIDGYETMNVGCYKEYVDYSQGVSSATQLTFAIDAVTPMLEALGLKYLVLPVGQRFMGAGYRLGFTGDGANIYERESSIPRAYVVHKTRIVPDRAKILPGLNAGFDFTREVIIEKASGVALPEKMDEGHVSRADIVGSRPGEVVIRASLSNAGVLVLSDVYYPGWTAYVDDRPSEILRANYAFRAVALDAGGHTVVFRYEPRSFALGARVTLAALVILAIYFCALAARRGG